MIGETLCSGIGAPEVAAPWIDWRRASDIDDFARAVFMSRHGYELDPAANRFLGGDFTVDLTIANYQAHGWPWPDVIVAGTPCQAFSVAGLRKGLTDDRGNLTLEFVKHVHNLTNASRFDGHAGPVIIWENVPGALTMPDNAFGAFLAGLVGDDDPLPQPFGESWPGEGMVEGPRGRAAWRVLDAQHFGLAQRRARLFVVFDPSGRADPAAVLFERKGVRGDTAAGGETRKDIAPCLSARTRGGGGLGTDFDLDGGLIAANEVGHGKWSEADVASTLRAGDGSGSGGARSSTLLAFNAEGADCSRVTTAVCATGEITHALLAEAHDASEDGTGRGNPIVAFALRGREGGALPEVDHDGLVPTLRAASGGSTRPFLANGWTVRRLTPIECERLQGFPDNYTLIPWRGGLASDSRRYKALGNSMAVPVLRWILRRLTEQIEGAVPASDHADV